MRPILSVRCVSVTTNIKYDKKSGPDMGLAFSDLPMNGFDEETSRAFRLHCTAS